jgi:hypothetical protein
MAYTANTIATSTANTIATSTANTIATIEECQLLHILCFVLYKTCIFASDKHGRDTIFSILLRSIERSKIFILFCLILTPFNKLFLHSKFQMNKT